MKIKRSWTGLIAVLCLAVALFAPSVAFAAGPNLDANPTGEYGDGTYSWNADTGTITFSAGSSTAIEDIYDADAIYANDAIEHVVIAEGVTSVGSSLLYNCDGIETVSLPSTLEYFGNNKSWYTPALPSCTIKGAGFTVDSRNTHFSAVDGNLYSADGSVLYRYVQKTDADSFTLPDSVSSICKGAFADNVFDTLKLGGASCKVDGYALSNTTVAHLKLEEGLYSLKAGSVAGLQDSTMHIPSTLRQIEDPSADAYSELFNPAIAAFDVDSSNPYFASIGGVLCDKVADASGKITYRLRIYPMAKQGESYTTPAGVTTISSCAFGYHKSVANLKELVLSPDVVLVKSDGIKVGASITRVLVMNKDCRFDYGALRAHQLSTYTTLGATLVAHVGSYAQEYGKKSENQYAVKQLRYFFTEDMITASPLMFNYDGKAHYPAIDAPLLNGEYNVIYPTDATSVGKKTMQVVAGGIYDGTISINYEIKGAAVKVSSATLASTKMTYAGKALKPAVTVKGANGKTLRSGTDYTVAYTKNTAVGKAVVTVTGKGDYAGKLTKSFTIVPKKAVVKSATVGVGKLTATASTKVSATGGSTYQVAYRVKGTSKWKTVTCTTKSKTIKKLKKGKVYQVRIRACKKVDGTTYYGAWSATKTTAKVK